MFHSGAGVTLKDIVRLLGGKRGGMCRCPNKAAHAHGDRNRSLSVRERDGWVRLKCFSGCTREQIVAAMGLRIRDLALGAMPDKAALALAERLRADEERKRKAKRRREGEAIDRARKWEACRDALGFLLIQRPEDSKLASLFHHACNMCRELPSTGYFDGDTDLRDVFPEHHPLDGITCQDVGRQVGSYLRLPNE